MLSDLRFAFRSLGKTPGFTVIAIATMAIAIGACTSLFSVLQAVVLRPLPYPDPDSLISIWVANRERAIEAPAVSWAKYDLFRARPDVFRSLSMSAGNAFTLTEGRGEPEQVFGQHVDVNFLPVLGLQLARGRNFTADEDREGGANVVILGYQLWQNRFAADPEILGRVIQIDGVPRTVVGILPERMPVPFNNTAILVPRSFDLPFVTAQQRATAIVHTCLGRLAPGVTLEQANLRLAEMVVQFRAANPGHIDAANTNEARTLSQQVLGNLGRTFWSLAGAVAAVLLIACANIANLFLARVSARQKEIAVRLSLGATRSEIIRQFIAESAVFSVAAGGLGVLLAAWSLRAIAVLAGPQLPRADEINLDPVVLAFSLGVALLAALLIGIYPALQASNTDVGLVLKDNSRGTVGGRAAKSFRRLLVIAQVALSLALLICAGLLVRSFYQLQQARLGFDPAGRAYGVINLPTSKYNTPELGREFFRRLDERLAQTPELAAGGATNALPLGGQGFISPYSIKGRPVLPVQERPLANLRTVTPGFFGSLGITLREGRAFTPQDRNDSEQVAILNETLAKKLFPGKTALDEYLLIGRNAEIAVRIVGVIHDVKSAGLAVPPPDEIFYPRDQRGGNFVAVVGRAQPGLATAAVIPVLRRVIAEIDPNIALATPQTMDQLVEQSIGVQRLTMSLLLVFAGLAALLAAVGVYSVMAYAVTQRTSEIGVRLALGASSRDILSLILRSGGAQVGIGLALGFVAALIAGRLLREALYEVQPLDPLVFATVALGFTAVAALACWIPARRATKVDPMVALRSE